MRLGNILPRAEALILLPVVVVCVATLSSSVLAQSMPSGAPKSYKIQVPGTQQWVDTNIDLRGGAKIRFTATGNITYPAGDHSYESKTHTVGTFGPDGLPRGFADLLHGYAVSGAGHGALIGRIGSAVYAQAFLVGTNKEYAVPVSGRLFLGLTKVRRMLPLPQGNLKSQSTYFRK